MSSRMFLGIEIGGTKLQFALGRGDGVLIASSRQDVIRSAGAPGILEQVREATRELARSAGLKDVREIKAIGIGFGGPVDADRGTILTSHQIEGWKGFPLADWARREFGVETSELRNDADCAGLGEALFGAGRGFNPVLYMNSGSGIGGALIINGEIYRGFGLGAMEIGHLRMGSGDHVLEKIASGWGIEDRMKSRFREGSILDGKVGGDPKRITVAIIGNAALAGDADCLETLRIATDAVGDALAHAVALVAPQRIVLGGGVSLLGEDLWIGPIRRRLDERAFSTFRGHYDVVAASLHEKVVLHGALAVAAKAESRASGEPIADRLGSP